MIRSADIGEPQREIIIVPAPIPEQAPVVEPSPTPAREPVPA